MVEFGSRIFHKILCYIQLYGKYLKFTSRLRVNFTIIANLLNNILKKVRNKDREVQQKIKHLE